MYEQNRRWRNANYEREREKSRLKHIKNSAALAFYRKEIGPASWRDAGAIRKALRKILEIEI
jgi:hypothetical protein